MATGNIVMKLGSLGELDLKKLISRIVLVEGRRLKLDYIRKVTGGDEC